MNAIPGSTALGYGFNALGPYDPSSLMSQAFTQSFSLGQTYTYPATNTEYAVPDNANVVPYTPLSGGTRVFQRQYDLQTYLSAAADISGSYGGFSGQLDLSFGLALQEWGTCFYAVTNSWFSSWMVLLQDVSQAALNPDFATILNALPDTFDATTRKTFFQFFWQYGTHFVHSVGVGGFFAYYEAVQNNGSYSEMQVQANVALEYQAVWVDGSVQANLDWQQLGQQWVNSRMVTITALGGDAEILSDVTPIFQTNEPTSYQKWVGSIESNPSAVQFILHPWDELLPVGSPQQSALQQALQAFMNFSIYVSALWDSTYQTGSALIVVGGAQVNPTNSWPASPNATSQGIEVVLLDNDTLAVTFSGVYYFDADADNQQALYAQLVQDLAGVATDNQWCCCSVFNYPWMILPNNQFVKWLQQFGITTAPWIENYGNCGGGQVSLNYAGLGLYGGIGVREAYGLNPENSDLMVELNVNPFLVEATLA